MTRKIAICTTFNNDNWEISAAEMLASFSAYWPQDIKIYIQLDEQTEETFTELNNKIIDILGEERVFIASLQEEDQKKFMAEWQDYKPESYLYDVVKFSHKVFALEKCADAIKDDIDVLIWLDSDVITKKYIDHEWLETVLPEADQVCSYLGRRPFYSECGWVAYNLKAGGYELLKKMKECYTVNIFNTTDWQGYTDCHVFDKCMESYFSMKNLSKHYIHGQDPLDVWPATKLAERLVHRKGERKLIAAQNRQAQQQGLTTKSGAPVIDAGNMKIKTKNCLDHEKICANIKENLPQIRNWVTVCRPSMNGYTGLPKPIILCSAGPSLASHINEIKELQERGGKVIAVKHAINTLRKHNIKPWAVVLLDPRAHVEGFINDPDPDPVYFVASMCDPSVVKTLNKHRCKVIGYHALVNAGEVEVMIPQDLPVAGGSATSTRSIGMFADMFGHKEFHLFGYDLCHHQKPDINEKSEDGNPKYMEINLGTYTYGNQYITRTFWTEGQFLAQSNEVKDLYEKRKDINITVYGDGMAGWLYKHHQLYKQYIADYNKKIDKKRQGTPTLEEFVNALTRGSDLSRGI